MLGLGVIGVVMAVVVIFTIIGRWSDVVIVPGLISMLCIVLLLESTISGVDILLLLKKVGKFGPRCIIFPRVINVATPFPTVLFCLLPNSLCFAFRSTMMYVGWLLYISLWISGYGKYGLRGGR